MKNLLRSTRALAKLLVLTLGVADAAPPSPVESVTATVETTLDTAGGQIRQFAFDGKDSSYFASGRRPGSKDHFTLVLGKPVAVRSIAVTTGRADGADRIEAGTLEVSQDGKAFRELAKFADGTARGGPVVELVRAIRLRPRSSAGPIAIRELAIDSEPPVEIFRYPVEFVVDVSDAPELKEWAEATARTCERAYPMINDELASDGFKPPRLITMTLSKTYAGVAAAGGDRIIGSVAYFAGHRDDVGAMVHETVHLVQHYRRGNHPSWLVEGVSDYIRFFKFEPGKLGRINPQTARYNRSYRVTAAFLAFLVETYDKEIVRKLNRAMREGHYKEALFQQLTGKTVKELDAEWRATLAPTRSSEPR